MQRMLAEAKAADAEEDAHYGPARRGNELPEGLGERLKRLKEAKERLQRRLKQQPRLSKSTWSNGGQKKRPQAKRSGAKAQGGRATSYRRGEG